MGDLNLQLVFFEQLWIEYCNDFSIQRLIRYRCCTGGDSHGTESWQSARSDAGGRRQLQPRGLHVGAGHQGSRLR